MGSFNLEAVYQKLPVWMQEVACSVEGWRIQRSQYGPSFERHLAALSERSCWTERQIQSFRDERLRSFVEHSTKTVPYYKELFRTLGLCPQDIRTLDDLKALPVLTKKEVQARSKDFVSSAVSKADQIVSHTSGTTGSGLRFMTTAESIQEQLATWWRYRIGHGIQRNLRWGYFAGRSVVPVRQASPPFWRTNVPGKQVLFSGYHMSPENLPFYVKALQKKRLPWLHGYPSLLSVIATYLLEEKIDLGYSVRWVSIGAENLFPHQAEVIERAFGVKPIQHYGMAEAVANISECREGNLHVDEDFSAVEFVQRSAGEASRIVGTNLSNLAFPLLRYDTQDLAEVTDEGCSCGWPGRLVKSLDGRKEDYLILKNGARLGRLDHIFKDLVHIREAQLYQQKPGEVDIRIVKGDGYADGDEQQLLTEFRKRVGEDTTLRIQYVHELTRSSTGKLRFVVSDIPEANIHGGAIAQDEVVPMS